MNRVLAELVSAEERWRLWERQVLGYPVWPLLRLERYRQALLSGDTAIAGQPKDQLPSLGKRLWRSASDVVRQGKFRKSHRDIWVVTSSTYRRRDQDGSYPCIFVEHVREQLGHRLQFIEINSAGIPLSDEPNVFLLDGYLRYIQGVATIAASRVSEGFISQATKRAFLPTPASELIRRAVYGQLLERLATQLIRAQRPTCAFVLCAYGSTIPIQRALGNAGVPMIEVQHGVIHESHPGYVFDEHVPKLAHRPDHLLLFGRHFGELLDRASPGLRTPWTVAGHPWLQRARERALREEHIAQSGPPMVVVFGQYDPPVQERMRQLLPALRRALPNSVQLVYKPHPREPVATLQPVLVHAGVTLAGTSDDSYKLLARCIASVTVYSTLAIEALAFPCASIVLRSPYWTEDIRALVDQGVLLAADTADDVARLLLRSAHRHEALADLLFGVSTPVPDFDRLITNLSQRSPG